MRPDIQTAIFLLLFVVVDVFEMQITHPPTYTRKRCIRLIGTMNEFGTKGVSKVWFVQKEKQTPKTQGFFKAILVLVRKL